ncbi:MAG: 3-methyladenine DNA glycosylase, partial [Nocardioides sp.]
MPVETLSAADVEARAAAHAARLAPYVEPHLARRARGEKHPVHDFLFTYYSQRPAQLLRWHPGFPGGGVTAEDVRAKRPLLEATRRLLVATAARPAHTGCFGLHEWAMVYRSTESDMGNRHPQPLRLGAAGTDAVIESHRIACSHFDAFRFFTDDARPRNTLQPGRDDRPAFEQPGCLHAGMDLYKHAFR